MRSVTCAIFLSLLMLAPTGATLCADDAPVLAEDICDGPFVLVVPAALVREHGSLTVVANDDGAGTRLRFDLTADAVAVSLERAGAITELARADVALPGGAGEVVVKRRADGASVAYDAATVLRAEADLPDGGRWGLLGPAAALEEIIFQPVGEIVFGDDFMRLPDQPATWETVSGDWRVAQLPSAKYSANAFTFVASAANPAAGLATTGYWFWEDLTVEAAVQPVAGTRGFGVGLAAASTGDCHLLRFLPGAGGAGRLQIVRLRGGQERVLAEAPALVTPDEWHRLALSGVAGRLTGALDGVELVSADDPSLAHGQACLWVAGETPVAFDDVEAYSGQRRVDRPVVLSNDSPDATAEEFINDEYMQEWADERDQWASGAGGVWHGGYFWGDVELTWELNERSLRRPAELHLCVPAGEDTYHPPKEITGGCHLALEATEDGQLALKLAEGEEARGEATVAMPTLPAQVALRRTGDLVEALVAGQAVASFTATTPAAGKVGLATPAARLYVSALRITAHNLIDATFRAAPSDWHIGSGEWGVASRWACTPRWSWFQGRSREVASIWTRRQFPGDVAVEFFAGTAMDQPWAPFYQHPGNLCVTLGGSDATPGSGYTLIFAGWGNSAAGIFRRGELVAQVPGFVMPDILDSLGGTSGREDAHKLHNEWWRIRAERVGSAVRLLVDGRLAASFDDPDPLPGGSVGIFTLDNAMTVARARIYYEDAQDVAPPMPIPETDAVAGAPALELPPLGPAHLAATFEDGIGAWGPAEPGSCAVALAEREGRTGGRCLRVTNPSAGGSFALAAPWAGVDLRRQPILAFDCAIPEGVAVDAFALVDGQRYRLALTGPEEPAPDIEGLGRAAEVRADGRWRAVNVDLLGRLRPFFAPDSEIVLEGLEFSARAATDYLRAGIGGNAAGASWRLDNVFLGAPTSGAADVRAPRGAQVDADGCSVQALSARGGPSHRVTARRSGLCALRVSANGRSATDLVAFDVDAPAVEPVTPTAGAAWLGSALILRVTDAGPAGVAEESLAVEVGGRRLAWPDPALHWDPATGELAVDLRAAGLTLEAGKSVPVRVAPVVDRAGNRGAPLTYAFTPDPAADATAPEVPRLVGLAAPLLDCDFEADAGTLAPWGVDADVALTRVHGPAEDSPAGGSWCLEARCTQLGGLFGVALIDQPFDARRYPVLSFDYRVPPELRVDLIVEVAGSRRVIKFTDNDATWRPIGSIGATADGQWHTATVDLQGLLERGGAVERGMRGGPGERGPRPGRQGDQPGVRGEGPLPVTALAFATSGWPGNRRDTRWWIDNVRLSAPLLVPLRAGVSPTLSARDASGTPNFAWTLDAASTAEPPAEAVNADLGAALAEQAGTLAWLHAAAIDASGNRSAVAHLPVRVAATDDLAPPVASAPTPGAEEAGCPSTITVTVADEGAGVSPADLRLTVGEATYSIADEALGFDATSGALTWMLPAGVTLGEDGARVACRLEATDLAGNAMAPLAWTWRIDRSLDAEPPAAPEASYLPAAVADANDFEEHTGGWGNFVEGQVLRRAVGGASGPGCLELRHLGGSRGNGFVLVRDFGDDWRRFPMVRFRYRLEGTRSAQLAITGTTFNGARDTWTELGTVPASGDGWRTATLDVAQALARTSPGIDIHRIFLNISPGSPDAAIIVDDYAMYSQAATSAAFAWAAPADPSGIRGYAWVLDNADDTVPPETITGTQTHAQFRDLAPGHWCFHVRACDGAGNWGPATHVPFDLIAPQ